MRCPGFRSIRVPFALTLALGLVATGCEEQMEPLSPAETDPAASNRPAAPNNASAAQVFTATLTPLNGDVSYRPVRGSAMVTVRDGTLSVRVDAQGLEPGIPHPQHIHGKMGEGACPDMSADENGDGLVDVIEGLPDYGGIMVTLDSDLTDGAGTQVDGLPTADKDGTIHYRNSADFEAVQAGAGEDLRLDERHIVLHGVDPALEETVLADAASIGDLPAWLTLPVACGELVPEAR